jgi:hypothetical protein
MKPIRNMRELQLMRQKLEYQEKLYEKEMAGSAADIVDNFTERLRDMVFDVGSRLILRLIFPGTKHAQTNE